MKPDDRIAQGSDRHGGSLSEFLHSWRYFLWAIGILVFVLLLFAEENWRGHHAWRSYTRTLAAKGEKIELSDFVPPRVPDDKNFAMTPFLAPLFDFLPGTQTWPTQNSLDFINHFASNYDIAAKELGSAKRARTNCWTGPATDLNGWYRAFLKARDKDERGSRLKAQPVSHRSLPPGPSPLATVSPGETNYALPEAAAGVLSMLSDVAPILDEVTAASKLPYSRFNLRYEQDDPAEILLPHLAVIKRLCLVLQLRASAELAAGKTEAAYQDVRSMLKIADSCRTEPFVISGLVRMAALNLAFQPIAEGMGGWSEPQLRAFEQELGELNLCADTKRLLQAERVWSAAVIDYFHRTPDRIRVIDSLFSGQGSSGLGLGANLMAIAPGWWFEFEKINCCRAIDENLLPAVDAGQCRIDPKVCEAGIAHIAEESNRSLPSLLFHHRMLSRVLVSGEWKALQKTAFYQTGVNCIRIACALELYHRAHGEFPETLDGLAPTFIPKVPGEVVNQNPLRYRRQADGRYSLYSVGWDEADQGGVSGSPEPEREGSVPTGDWALRLP